MTSFNMLQLHVLDKSGDRNGIVDLITKAFMLNNVGMIHINQNHLFIIYSDLIGHDKYGNFPLTLLSKKHIEDVSYHLKSRRVLFFLTTSFSLSLSLTTTSYF